MKYGLIVLAVGLFFAGACAPEGGDYRKVESSPQDWILPGPETETRVFGPMPYETVHDFVESHESVGWMLIRYEPAGEHLDGKYLVTMRRWK